METRTNKAVLVTRSPESLIREAFGYTVGTNKQPRSLIVKYLKLYADLGCDHAKYWLNELNHNYK